MIKVGDTVTTPGNQTGEVMDIGGGCAYIELANGAEMEFPLDVLEDPAQETVYDRIVVGIDDNLVGVAKSAHDTGSKFLGGSEPTWDTTMTSEQKCNFMSILFKVDLETLVNSCNTGQMKTLNMAIYMKIAESFMDGTI